ncbi:MAG: DUF4290 domain-containing protein [Candidatus Shikimatogenerans bostrichidophilus]|nr:MAG: DUF4290 domain-containing protein [Candidatus Shikimatogenerans bostrichidophilus]
MEYNTSRKNIIIPQYGRNIEKFVDKIVKIKNKKIRNKNAIMIINIMSNINNNKQKNIIEYKRRLWEQLFLISKMKLKVDYPFKINKLKIKKKKILFQKKYKLKHFKYKYYGKIIQYFIKKILIKINDKEIKKKYIYIIANLMKYNYIKWNKINDVEDKIIFKDIKYISKGKIDFTKNFNFLNKIDKKKIYNIKKKIYNKYLYFKKKKK